MKMTSDKWEEVLLKGLDIEIYDPDGWDRSNYTYSFYEEEIDADEFMKRLFISTVMADPDHMMIDLPKRIEEFKEKL